MYLLMLFNQGSINLFMLNKPILVLQLAISDTPSQGGGEMKLFFLDLDSFLERK